MSDQIRIEVAIGWEEFYQLNLKYNKNKYGNSGKIKMELKSGNGTLYFYSRKDESCQITRFTLTENKDLEKFMSDHGQKFNYHYKIN